MSIVSNHFPEVLDAQNGSACTCPPDGNGVGEMCETCRAEYDAWRAQQAAEPFDPELDAVVGILPEPCGQQFPDGPLPDDMPF